MSPQEESVKSNPEFNMHSRLFAHSLWNSLGDPGS
ncbi:hypothetical protein OIU79_017445, partial [Salix purpurea]